MVGVSSRILWISSDGILLMDFANRVMTSPRPSKSAGAALEQKTDVQSMKYLFSH